MRQITYRRLPPVGPRDPFGPVTGSLADFVQDIPYFLSFDLIPPISVMNEELGSGEHDAGMSGGCVWEPFTITEEAKILKYHLKAVKAGQRLARFIGPFIRKYRKSLVGVHQPPGSKLLSSSFMPIGKIYRLIAVQNLS